MLLRCRVWGLRNSNLALRGFGVWGLRNSNLAAYFWNSKRGVLLGTRTLDILLGTRTFSFVWKSDLAVFGGNSNLGPFWNSNLGSCNGGVRNSNLEVFLTSNLVVQLGVEGFRVGSCNAAALINS